MKLLLSSATIIDSKSPYHKQTVSILIENGIISKIDTTIKADKETKVISLNNLHVSQGWFDSGVALGEPGYEERETIENGLLVAAKSGFTSIALQPDTKPLVDTSSTVSFLQSKSEGFATQLLPIGNLTVNSDGKDIAELFDMYSHGAISFGDYKKPIKEANLLKIALQYSQGFDGLVQSFPLDNSIKGKGSVNEHISSTQLGLKGIPNLAEELQIARDLFILEYTGGKLHIPTISTEKSVQLIKEAKEKGLDVSCSVSVNNLVLNDNELSSFDTNFKIAPPLRTQKDCEALIEGVLNGTIDMITSDHCPMDVENKLVEFDNSAYGSIGLESIFGALQTVLPTDIIIEKLTASKKRFGINEIVIKEGSTANITLFNPNESYTFTKEHIYSFNKNAAFLGKKLKGKVYGIIANGKVEI